MSGEEFPLSKKSLNISQQLMLQGSKIPQIFHMIFPRFRFRTAVGRGAWEAELEHYRDLLHQLQLPLVVVSRAKWAWYLRMAGFTKV